MSIQIIKNIPTFSGVDVIVEPEYSEKRGFFGPRVGNVTVSDGEGTGKYRFRVVCPKEYDEQGLRRGYRQCVRQAMKLRAASMAIPLLLPKGQGMFARPSFHLGLRILRQTLGEHPMEVCLIVSDPGTVQIPLQRRQDLTDYLNRNTRITPDWNFPSLDERHARQYTTTSEQAAPPCPMPSAPNRQSMPSSASAKRKGLEQLLRHTDAGFSETLLKLIDKTGKKDSVIYNRANVSRQHFSKIRNNPGYKPTKATAIAFAIALELDLAQTQDLIARAGYALTRSSKFDLIIMYFIENKNYNLFDINEALFEFDQSLLGA